MSFVKRAIREKLGAQRDAAAAEALCARTVFRVCAVRGNEAVSSAMCDHLRFEGREVTKMKDGSVLVTNAKSVEAIRGALDHFNAGKRFKIQTHAEPGAEPN